MKVLTFSIKSAVIITLICVSLIVLCTFLVFGGNKKENLTTPEIEIVLPEEVKE